MIKPFSLSKTGMAIAFILITAVVGTEYFSAPAPTAGFRPG